jgi:uncharacterized membrane protein YeiH
MGSKLDECAIFVGNRTPSLLTQRIHMLLGILGVPYTMQYSRLDVQSQASKHFTLIFSILHRQIFASYNFLVFEKQVSSGNRQ